MKSALAAVCALLLLGACAGKGRFIQRKAAKPQAPVAAESLSPTAQAEAAAPVTVAKGDSLWRLSRQHLGAGIRYPELAAANSIRDPWIIQPGQTLSLPNGSAAGTQRPAAAPTAAVPSPKAAATATAKAQREAAKYGWKARPNRAYTVGEKLTFAVQYGAITAGYATLSVNGPTEVQGRPTYHILAEAKTHPFFEKIFKVRDLIESFIDVDYGFPWRYEKHLREGSYQADAFYLFDQRGAKITEPDKGKEAPMPIGSQDVLSCFYWFRTLPLQVGDEAVIPVTADDMKTYELKVNVLRKERVKTLAGDFDCVVVQPHLTFQGVFQQKGEVFLWITDDERRIPVKIRSKIVIGNININLQDAEWVEPANN